MGEKTSFLTGLNPEQLKAVTYEKGSLLVLAGAGSGKTKVLTTRLAWLIKQKDILLTGVLAVTFTNKAAREMLSRVERLLKIDTRFMWVGTFHAIGLRLLRLHYQQASLPANFQIIDVSEQQSLIRRLIKIKGLDEERFPAKELQSYINYHKELGCRAAEVRVDGLRSQKWQELYTLYESVCNSEGLVDFTELLLRSYELLITNTQLLNQYQTQFKHILVDEFQDTNQLQYKWIGLLCGRSNSIFAVGDDDQSIYAFRGAKVSNMRAFLQDFNAPEPMRLEQNYRSTPTILAAANAIINNNSERIGKSLWTNRQTNDKIRLYEGYTEEDEAYFVVDEIKSLVSHGIDLTEVAILYRSNAQSRVFEQHFYNSGIAYRVYGGLRFYDRHEIKRVLAYLRLIVNPHDNEAFLRVVNFPTRGVGPKTLEVLQELAIANNVSLFNAIELLSGKQQQVAQKFANLILQMQLESKGLSLSEVISYIIEASGMHEHFTHDKDGAERLENLNELVIAVSGFVPEHEGNQVVEFLAHAVLESVEHQAQQQDAAVQLMTVHAAKGLEFNIVFVVGLEDGLFPHENSLQTAKNIEEERRLMYVAITRAREKLYLLRACSRSLWGKRIVAPISRFVNEIPQELILNLSGLSQIGYNQLNEYAGMGHYMFSESCDSKVDNPESKTSRVELKDKDLVLKIGDMVKHAKFGEGKILRLNTDGKKNTAEIFFIGVGKKTLDLNIANIDKVH